MEDHLQAGYSLKAYFMDVYKAASKRLEVEPYVPEMEGQIIIAIIASIYKDYKSAVDTLMESIDLLVQEVASLQATQPRPDIPAPIPFSLANTKTPGTTAGSGTQPLGNPLLTEPKASWATVARRGGKKRNTFQTSTTPTQLKPTTSIKPSQPRKGIIARERRLIVKREGGPLNKTELELRNEINTALSGTYIQTVSVKGNTITINTMESIRATSLNSKVGTFLHLIPGTVSVHLDTPVTQLLVHGLPTSSSLDAIATELTTFNTGLALTGQPRWLTMDESRVGKAASTIVIAITGLRAPDFVGRRLAAFSSTYRTERRLCFNSNTQCSNCHGFAHHNNRCNNSASCRWCAHQHPTGAHTCPTATCRIRGHPCSHTALKCVNCGGPHEAHSMSCPTRPDRVPQEGENEEEMADT